MINQNHVCCISSGYSSSFHSKHRTCNNRSRGKEKIKLVEEAGRLIEELVDMRRELIPIATSDNNVYVTWWTNKTGNDEIMFRASTDNGITFGDKMNLSNTTEADSDDAEIAASGNSVYVTWWERNDTSVEPVARVSNDNGATFGPLLRLAANGTIGGVG